MTTYLMLLAIGLVAGVFAGMFGIGGGLVIVPALLFLMKMPELQAIGTSLAALIPPVGLLGAIAYYRAGHINVKYALIIAAGLFIGAYFGAKIVLGLPPTAIRRLYAAFLLIIAGRMLILGK
ncbi:MAG TPA: permease [Solibacterales bacterium]|nr:permease [Bryobacterales bacterium]